MAQSISYAVDRMEQGKYIGDGRSEMDAFENERKKELCNSI